MMVSRAPDSSEALPHSLGYLDERGLAARLASLGVDDLPAAKHSSRRHPHSRDRQQGVDREEPEPEKTTV